MPHIPLTAHAPQSKLSMQRETTLDLASTLSRLSTTFLNPQPSPQVPTLPLPKATARQDYFNSKGLQLSLTDSWLEHPPPPPPKLSLHLPRLFATKHARPSLQDIRHPCPSSPALESPPCLPDLRRHSIDLASWLDKPPTPPPKDTAPNTPQFLRKTRRVKTAPITPGINPLTPPQ
ncbi:hypothetical protein EK21DRAFT_118890 [Setomelanomma holmii]|uniref:Uncharacterized protein n=1 Tax=Setomelanomma holmii TaxID=210430 RepID=A0A9P4GWR9_9PLEO|nr:hypothetical protein EK21DRAFT_118890 [Setomelanomma holmii]